MGRERWGAAAQWGAAAAAAGAWVVLVIVHLNDRFLVDHVSGVRMALAYHAMEGQLYPPLFDGEVFGGSRYLPLGIVAHAALAQLTGSLLVGGKILGALTMALLGGLVVVVTHRAGCPWRVAAVLGGSLLAAQPGWWATFGMRADALPTALQVGAVAVVTAGTGPWGALAAGVLAGIALSTKLTAIWAAVAIVIWLLVTDRHRLLLFATAWAVTALGLLAIFEAASQGRMTATVLPLMFAGIERGGGPFTALSRLPDVMAATPAVAALLPVAAVAAIHTARTEGLTAWHFGLVAQLPLLLVVFTDIGAEANHLVDLAALTAVMIGLGAARVTWNRLSVAAAVFVVWIVVSAVVLGAGPDLHAALKEGRRTEPPPLADLVRPGEAVLSDDPGLSLQLGLTPVVTDPFMLPRIERLEPAAVAALADRIRRQEFAMVALTRSLEHAAWWRHLHFGETVATAIREAYQPVGQRDGYHLYRPR